MELEEETLRELQDYLKFYKYHGWVHSMEKEINVPRSIEVIETVLEALKNSIPKKKIKDKIKELECKEFYQNFPEDYMAKIAINEIRDLLEDKKC